MELAGRAAGCTCSTTRTRSRCRSPQIVAGDAERGGIAVAAHDSLDMTDASATTSFKGEVEKIAESGAQAVFFAGGTGTGTVALWQAAAQRRSAAAAARLERRWSTANLHLPDRRRSGREHLPDDAVLPVGLYPPPGRAGARATTAGIFGGEAGAYALYGYEAMSVVLRRDPPRRRARERPPGGDRPVLRDPQPQLGARPLLDRTGRRNDALDRYGVDRVQDGQPVFYRVADRRPLSGLSLGSRCSPATSRQALDARRRGSCRRRRAS